MGAPWRIWVQNQQYYRYGTYSTHERALQIARKYVTKSRKPNKKRVRSFILKHETGNIFPHTMFTVYFNNIINATK